MPVVLFICFVGGVIFGTQLEWPWQLAAVFLFYMIMESPYVRSMEIGAILPYIMGIWFLIGVFVGDILWFIQTGAWENFNFSNPFVVN